jgi:hypothetical protein
MTSKERPPMKFNFSPEVRLGEMIAALAVVGGGIAVWTGLNAKVAAIEQNQITQAQTTREVRQEIRDVAVEIKTDIRDLRQEMRGRARSM